MAAKNKVQDEMYFEDNEVYRDGVISHINVATGLPMDLPPLPNIMHENDAWLEYYDEEQAWSDDSNDSVQKVVMDALLKSKSDEEKLQLRARKRKHAIDELLSTERTYVDLMTKLVNHYVNKLQTKNKIISPDDYKTIFPSIIQVIVKLNSTFLFDLQTVIESDKLNSKTDPASPKQKLKKMKTLGIVMTNETLGQLLINFCPHFAMYKSYTSNYSAAATRLSTLRKKSSSAFSKYCDKQMSAGYFNHLCLESLIILPIQRMPRYKLLVQEIIKHTDPSHDDLEQLNKALAEISKVNDSINANMKDLEARVQVQNIENRFKGKINNLVSPSRRFIRKGTLCKLEPDEQVFYLFILFNDSILYASESMFGNKLIFGNLIEFNAKFDIKKTSGPLKLVSNIKNLFEIHSTKESFFLFAESQREMNKWCKIVNKIYDEYMSSGTLKEDAGLFYQALFLPNNFAEKCMVKGCRKKFTVVNRKCHCFLCGFIVCASHRKSIVKHKTRGKIKICDVCFKNYSKAKKNELQRINTQKLTAAALSSLSPIPSPVMIPAAFKEVPNFNPLNASIVKSVRRKRLSTMMKQGGFEEILVTGYLRMLSFECQLNGVLGSNIVYLCNLSYGSMNRKTIHRTLNFNKRYSRIKRKKKIQY